MVKIYGYWSQNTFKFNNVVGFGQLIFCFSNFQCGVHGDRSDIEVFSKFSLSHSKPFQMFHIEIFFFKKYLYNNELKILQIF